MPDADETPATDTTPDAEQGAGRPGADAETDVIDGEVVEAG